MVEQESNSIPGQWVEVTRLWQTNSAPVADAGEDQTVHVGNVVTLNGSGSTDPNGDIISYAWTLVEKPAGSLAQLSDAHTVGPTFTVDAAGNYVLQLVVTDIYGWSSQADTVTISTTNSAPVVDAGEDQSVTLIGSIIQLDGSQSFDPDGDTITYHWQFVRTPPGSAATLSDPSNSKPTFTVDMYGTYEVQLVVTDPWVPSSPDTVTVSFGNLKPVADAGTSQSVLIGETVPLDGSGSSDPNGDGLTYTWTLSSFPTGSLSAIADPTASITSFVPDMSGSYVVQLIVSDGLLESDPSTVQIQAAIPGTAAIEAVRDVTGVVSGIDEAVFMNRNMKNTIINKLNAVIANIEAGNYADALGQLRNDILGKTDGCATSAGPDKDDWITHCETQDQIYPLILLAIQEVMALT